MQKLPKYSRQYINELTDYICSVYKIKRKEFDKKLEDCDYSALQRYMKSKAVSTRRKSLCEFYRLADHEICMLLDFKNSLHFCINNDPPVAEYNAFAEGFNKDIFIDFQYAGMDCFLHVWHRKYPVYLEGNEQKYDYHAILYMNRQDMFEYNRNELGQDYGQLWKYAFVLKLYISSINKQVKVEIPDANQWCRNLLQNKYSTTCFNEIVFILTDELNKLNIPDEKYLVNLVNHVIYCYNNRAIINRKNGKAARKYNECKVHEVSTEATGEDIYIPLAKCKYDHTKKGTGHHASPVEHDRIGFYRKSRGRGDYDLVDGEYVYVGNMQGTYSKVSSTHVDGRTSKKHKIYKV